MYYYRVYYLGMPMYSTLFTQKQVDAGLAEYFIEQNMEMYRDRGMNPKREDYTIVKIC